MNIEIVLETNQIKLDVETETRKAALMQIAEDRPEERIEAGLGDEFSDVAYFTRQEKLAVDSIVAMLHKYVTGYSYQDVEGADYDERESYANTLIYDETSGIVYFTIKLSVPERRVIMPGVLAGAAHKYVVYHVLHSWSVMALPSMAAAYMELRDSAAREIQTMVTRKTPPLP